MNGIRMALVAGVLVVGACGGARETARAPADPPEVMRLVTEHARRQGIPPSLMHRVVSHESGYDPGAQNGPYYGLMQIAPQTARTMGHRGAPESLLDPGTNLTYGGRYLRGAWLVARGDEDQAIMWYRKGYYYEAKRMGLLEQAGLR